MLANYSNDPKLFDRCMQLIDKVFPGCKEFALNGTKYKASWYDASIPFIIEEKGEIIAHAGVLPITLMLNGKEHHTAAIHAVCVKPEHRGKGHFKHLMQEAMQYTETNFASSILFTENPDLYRNYPYKVISPEYDFVVNDKIKFSSKNSSSDIRILNLDNSNDLNLTYNLLYNRIPLSNQLSIINGNGNTLFIFNTLSRSIHFLEKLNVLIIFEIVNNTLYIKEIVSTQQCQIADIVASITGNFDKVVLQFCPDRFLDEEDYTAILAKSESYLMTSKQFSFDSKYFRYPALYCC